MIRYYQLFIGYNKIKKTFRLNITKVFNEFRAEDERTKSLIGRYIYDLAWKIFQEKDRNNLLKLHVNWVFLVHLANNFFFSFFIIITNLFISGYDAKITKELSLLIFFQALIYFYLRRVALKSLNKSNFSFICEVNSYKEFIRKNIPNNLKLLIDECEK